MTVQTRNTRYTLEDAGDGAWRIQGHARYCPEPILVSLAQPPMVGTPMMFRYEEDPPVGVRRWVVTSTVQSIEV